VFTELDVIKTITGLEAIVIGRDGIDGAEGAVGFSVEGPRKECAIFTEIIKNVKGVSMLGEDKFPEECSQEIKVINAILSLCANEVLNEIKNRSNNNRVEP